MSSNHAKEICPHAYVYAGQGFSSFHLSIPFFVLNGMGKERLFKITFFATDEGVKDDSGFLKLDMETAEPDLEKADLLIIPDWPSTDHLPSEKLVNILQEAHRRNILIVGLCLGAYALSYAGITQNKHVATHWACEEDFLKRFPKTYLEINHLYVKDGNLLTSAGGTASLDCCLHLVKIFYGTKKANETARWIVFPMHRDGGQAQFIERPIPQSASEERLRELLPWLSENLEKPHTVTGLSARLWMSKRTFNRHFQKLTGQSFKEWLTDKRLQHAQKLLSETALRIDEIAYKSGYSKEQSFRTAFLKRVGMPPSKWRQRTNQKD